MNAQAPHPFLQPEAAHLMFRGTEMAGRKHYGYDRERKLAHGWRRPTGQAATRPLPTCVFADLSQTRDGRSGAALYMRDMYRRIFAEAGFNYTHCTHSRSGTRRVEGRECDYVRAHRSLAHITAAETMAWRCSKHSSSSLRQFKIPGAAGCIQHDRPRGIIVWDSQIIVASSAHCPPP